MKYDDFLKSKIKLAEQIGFDVADSEVNPILKPHQRDMVRWMCKKGRKFVGSELSTRYFMDACHYLKSAENEMSMPGLFDTLEAAA